MVIQIVNLHENEYTSFSIYDIGHITIFSQEVEDGWQCPKMIL